MSKGAPQVNRGSTASEKLGSTAGNWEGWDVLVVDLHQWMTARNGRTWKEITQSRQQQIFVPHWELGLIGIIKYFSSIFTEYFTWKQYLWLIVCGPLYGYLNADPSIRISTYSIVWTCVLTWIATWIICFLFEALHPHFGGPGSCVGCDAFGSFISLYWLFSTVLGITLLSLLESNHWLPVGTRRPAFVGLLEYYWFVLLMLTLGNLPVYGMYPHLWGPPTKSTTGVVIIIVIMFVLPFVI